MKRIAFIMMAILLAVIPSTAQNYKNSRYYNKKTGHLDYRYNHSYGAPYFGFRIGPAFTYVNSDDPRLDGGDWQTGLNVGVVAGIPLTDTAPLYLETGLSYIEIRWQERSGFRQEDDLRPQLSADSCGVEIQV